MGSGRASVLQRGIDETAHSADAAGDGAGDLCCNCVKEGIGVGACGNRSVVSKQRWTALFRPRLRQRPRRSGTQGRRARFTPFDATPPFNPGRLRVKVYLEYSCASKDQLRRTRSQKGLARWSPTIVQLGGKWTDSVVGTAQLGINTMPSFTS